MPSSPTQLSDWNVSSSRASIVSKNRPYQDLDMSLAIHPDLHDVMPLTDTDAVKNALINLVLTNFSERPHQPQVAAGLQSLLFEPADKFTQIALRDSIERVVSIYEPRVDQVSIAVRWDQSSYSYRVTVGFRVISTGQADTVSIKLDRIR